MKTLKTKEKITHCEVIRAQNKLSRTKDQDVKIVKI